MSEVSTDAPSVEARKQDLSRALKHVKSLRDLTQPRARTLLQQNVESFMKAAGQFLPQTPVIPPEAVRLLRARIIWEECLETIAGLGCAVENNQVVVSQQPPDLVQIVDGCCDIEVVTNGTLLACGVADLLPQLHVDYSNLMKFYPNCTLRADGKVIKPPGWQPPDIMSVLVLQGYELKDGKTK